MNTKLISGFCFLAIMVVAFFIVRERYKHACIAALAWAYFLLMYVFAVEFFELGYTGSLVVNVDQLTTKGDDLFFDGHLVEVEKKVPPMLFLRCKEEIVLRVKGEQYSLFIEDNI